MALPPARPAPRVLSRETLDAIAAACARYPRAQSALLPALHAAQAQLGYLPEPALADVGDALGLPVTEVTAVATFYTMLFTEPVGRHIVRVCTNLTCHLCGAGPVLDRLRRGLGIRPGQTTADGRVTLEIAECLAACDEAPVLLVDTDRLARVTPEAADDLVRRLGADG
ncbi:MAG TPA: NADH-quinone oxidoreductase subunit NuoE [bacterium]|nr:NADH-quinone oxidoreductase subunit NuoE [bacterium]